MNKTISELAKEKGVSTQAIYKRIKKIKEIEEGLQPTPTDFEPITNHIFKDDTGATVIDEVGCKLLSQPSDNQFTTNCEPVVNEHLLDLQKQIELLTEQLKVKDVQLERRDQQIETLQSLVSQAHTLAQTAQIKELPVKKKGLLNWLTDKFDHE